MLLISSDSIPNNFIVEKVYGIAQIDRCIISRSGFMSHKYDINSDEFEKAMKDLIADALAHYPEANLLYGLKTTMATSSVSNNDRIYVFVHYVATAVKARLNESAQ